ncbi:MAG: Glu-tRNA(Gln) amidotransferase subunit GatE, partial [archaeon]
GKFNVYRYNDDIACLVDLDEEPPRNPNKLAISTAIRVSQMLNLKFFNKLQFMRKLIINGSITSGYQRTTMLGLGGYIDTSFGKVEINGINLEEDACRIVEKNNNKTIYSLDRQGIPLIEITTGPQIKLPEQALEVSIKLGNLLRSFKETKRGIGTIRQDLNVSIKGGARIEIKGVQNLKLIPKIIEDEVKRQIVYLSILDELKKRKINTDNLSNFKIYDVSEVFEKTDSEVILSNLKDKNSKVLGIKLNNFIDILGVELQENYRFATEISNRNKQHFPEIKGLFHLDELPKYGITSEEVELVKKKLNLSIHDSFILLAGEKNVIEKSLKNILEIIKELIYEVPSEVRQVDPKGTKTIFLRHMPGSARMYPETDIEDIEITKELLEEEKKKIPELFDKKIKRLTKEFNLDEFQIKNILNNFDEENFKILLSYNVKPSIVYSTIFDIPKEIKKRENIEIVDFNFNLIKQVIDLLNQEKLNKNSIYNLYLNLYKNSVREVDDLEKYLKNNNLIAKEVDEQEIEQKIKKIVSENQGAPFGALMGIVMKEFSGNIDGKKVSQILKKLV